jgi:hypothetical protein
VTPEVHYRDAVTGEYVTREYALANPATTVAEIDDLEDEPVKPDFPADPIANIDPASFTKVLDDDTDEHDTLGEP